LVGNRKGALRRSLQQRSIQFRRFLRKLRYKPNETVWFRLVREANRLAQHDNTDVPHYKCFKKLRAIEKRVNFIKLRTNEKETISLESKNKQGYAIHVVVNAGGDTDEEIREVRAHFIDMDLNKLVEFAESEERLWQKAKELERMSGERFESAVVQRYREGEYQLVAIRSERWVRKMKRAFRIKYRQLLQGAMIVETRSGFQLYWPIAGGDPARFTDIQWGLIRKFGGDPAIANVSSVMRVPGYYHVKDSRKPFMTRVLRWGRAKAFTQDELLNMIQ